MWGRPLVRHLDAGWESEWLQESILPSFVDISKHLSRDSTDLSCMSLLNLFGDIDEELARLEYDAASKLRELGCKYIRRQSTEKQWENGVFRVHRESSRRTVITTVFRELRNTAAENYNVVRDLLGSADRVKECKVALTQLIGTLELFMGFMSEELAPFKMKNPPHIVCDSVGRFHWSR